ncbi:MATE family efflux transporter [Spirochaeta isovalerica]|uniref:Multidrug-efflux transporter n=1 Tax=Spirochaeta isovalerica TaxID=150 RepID=A0A841R711_9SPIO|nr:MATE family efflux transporter [Spirochaeta isovalerica]MBB6478769.1 putative MATE family efflux protein [Spirochaeta isovalerica]
MRKQYYKLRGSSYVLSLALPVMGTQIANTMVQLVDTMFIGRIDALSLGAVALTGTLIWNIQMISEGFATGLTATIARRIGEKEAVKASEFLRTGLIATLFVSFIFLPLIQLGFNGLFGFIQMPSDLYPFASSYFKTFMVFLPSIYGLTAIQAAFNACGETRTTMKVSLAMNLINIVLDWAMIFGHLGFEPMGIAGAAYASGISFTFGFLILLLISSRREWSPFKKSKLFSYSHLKLIIKIGIPSLISNMAMGISQMAVMVLAVTPLGSLSLGAFNIVMKLASLSFMPGFGFAIAASTGTGQSLGAGEPEKAKAITRLAVFYCTVVMAIISIAYYTIPDLLIGLFSTDISIVSMTRSALRIYALFAVFLAPAMVFSGTIRGAGDTRYAMIVMIISRFLLRLPAAWLFGIVLKGGLSGVWLAMCLDFLVRGIVMWIRFRGGKWAKAVA